LSHETRTAIDASVASWLTSCALPGQQVTTRRSLSGGFSNDTTLISTGTGCRYVLRRFLHRNTCPMEVALTESLSGLLPVPEVVAADPQGTVAGQPVMLTRFMPGIPLSEALHRLSAPDAEEIGEAVGATLAVIGTVTFASPGFFLDSDLEPVSVGPGLAADLPVYVEDRLSAARASDLTESERDALRSLVAKEAPSVAHLDGARQLVHSDFNPKNVLVHRQKCRWTVSAVLDWECAFSGPPLFDIGNMLRFEEELTPDYVEGFLSGLRASSGELPERWRDLSKTLDLYALAGFLALPSGHPFLAKAAAAIRKRINEKCVA
jgi:aminoglycoside phosphotransferase (APT) family kinase protein